MSVEEFTDRLQRLADALVDHLGGSATCRKDEDEPYWLIEPVRPDASPLWFAGSSAWDLSVGFGRASSQVELGFNRHVSDDEALGFLTEICMAVIGGGLVEWRKRDSLNSMAPYPSGRLYGPRFGELALAKAAVDASAGRALPAIRVQDLVAA